MPFVLETNASIHGLGTVLAQKQADGKVHPIAYVSWSLNCHEHNYGITELETQLGLGSTAILALLTWAQVRSLY